MSVLQMSRFQTCSQLCANAVQSFFLVTGVSSYHITLCLLFTGSLLCCSIKISWFRTQLEQKDGIRNSFLPLHWPQVSWGKNNKAFRKSCSLLCKCILLFCRPYHALLLLNDEKSLLNELPLDCSPALVRVIKTTSAVKNLQQLAQDADLALLQVWGAVSSCWELFKSRGVFSCVPLGLCGAGAWQLPRCEQRAGRRYQPWSLGRGWRNKEQGCRDSAGQPCSHSLGWESPSLGSLVPVPEVSDPHLRTL